LEEDLPQTGQRARKLSPGLGSFLSRVVLLLSLLIYVAESLYLVFFGVVHVDEGWYLYAARLVYGGQVPYVDFAHFQAPLLPYVYGLPLRLLGSSLLVGRFVSFTLNLLIVLLLVYVAAKLGGYWASAVSVACMATFPQMLHMFNFANNTVLATSLAVVGTFFLFTGPGQPTKNTLATLFWWLAVAARISFAPAAALVTLTLLIANRGRLRNVLATAAAAIAVVSIVFGPFALLAPGRTVFNILTAQAERSGQWGAVGLPTQETEIWEFLLGNGLLYIAALGILVVLGVYAASMLLNPRQRARLLAWLRAERGKALLLVAAISALLYLPNLLTGDLYPGYLAATAPFLALLAGLGLAWGPGQRPIMTGLTAASLICGFACLLLFQPFFSSTNPTELEALQAMGDYLTGVVPANRNLFTLDTTLAVEADRAVTHGTEMESHSYWPFKSTSECVWYHLINDELVNRAITDPATGAVVLSEFELWLLRDRSLTFRDSLAPLTEEEIARHWPELGERYRLDRVFAGNSAFYGNNVYVLLPRR
jgi:uncharacterized membrane protein SpoIIM required for sporulation